jgi:hypothetical protein
MEKHLSLAGYWVGVVSTVVALIFRVLIAFHVNPPHIGSVSGIAISYTTFLHGAVLFFLLSIASWCRTTKS